MVHHPCSIFFQNDQYLSSFQVILSPKSKRNDKKILVFGGGGLNKFFRPPPPTLNFFLGGGGLKTETGNFLRHFQNSKSSD